MSNKKKKNIIPWIKCDDCGEIFSEKYNSDHSLMCNSSKSNRIYPFVKNKVCHTTIETFSLQDPSLQFLSVHEKSSMCLMTQISLQLCEIPIGDPVIITGEDHKVVRRAWRGSDKQIISAALMENDSCVPFVLGSSVTVSKLTEELALAKKVTVIYQGNDECNTSISNRLQETQKGKILCKENIVAISFYGKHYSFTVSEIIPWVDTESVNNLDFYYMSDNTEWVIASKNLNTANSSNKTKIGGMLNVLEDLSLTLNIALSRDTNIPGPFKTHGILLYGPSGTGKTLLMRSVAENLEKYIVEVSSEKLIENPEKYLEQCYALALLQAPSIITIDDLDILCSRHRSNRDHDRSISSSLSLLFDRLHSANELVVVIATARDTNVIDKSLRRPGRFDKEVELYVPGPDERLLILKAMLSQVPVEISAEDIKLVADSAHGFVGADLMSLVSLAVSGMMRRAGSSVTKSDLLTALAYVKPSALKEVLVQVPNVRWSDIGGQDELKHLLKQAIEWPLKRRDSFQRLGITPPRGVLMYGPPGCSKTMIAKALATETGLNFISVKGPELFSKWVGDSEKAVREIFRRARQAAPSIVFFDELDALAGERSSSAGGSQVQERVLAQLLTEMDGVEALGAVTVVGATNRPDRIDPALLRPGRLDRVVYVPLPDLKTRREIFIIQFRKTPVAEDVCIDELAELTDGYSGAEVTAVCYEAAMSALDSNKDAVVVYRKDFLLALQLVKPRTSSSSLDLCKNYSRM